MAHWAQLDDDNKVILVFVGSNNDPDEGYQWLIDNIGGTFIKCSYNTREGVHILGGTPFRGNYPGPGWSYDEALDAFIPPKPTSGEWILNTTTYSWDPVEP